MDQQLPKYYSRLKIYSMSNCRLGCDQLSSMSHCHETSELLNMESHQKDLVRQIFHRRLVPKELIAFLIIFLQCLPKIFKEISAVGLSAITYIFDVILRMHSFSMQSKLAQIIAMIFKALKPPEPTANPVISFGDNTAQKQKSYNYRE